MSLFMFEEKTNYLKVGVIAIFLLPLVFSYSGFLGCSDKDACDEARQQCYNQGSQALNCRESTSGCKEKCECECYSRLRSSLDFHVDDVLLDINNSNVSFGILTLGQVSEKKITITNIGKKPVFIGDFSDQKLSDQPFSILENSCFNQTIEPGEKGYIFLRFKPTVSGVFFDSFSLPVDEIEEGELEIIITGEAVEYDAPDIKAENDPEPSD